MGYKIDGVQYWLCASCDTPPFKSVTSHTYHYHLSEELQRQVKHPKHSRNFEFPELWDKCTDATFNTSKEYVYNGKYLSTSEEGCLQRQVDPSAGSLQNQQASDVEMRESATGHNSSENNNEVEDLEVDEDDALPVLDRYEALRNESEDSEEIKAMRNSMRISDVDEPVQSQRVEKHAAGELAKKNSGTSSTSTSTSTPVLRAPNHEPIQTLQAGQAESLAGEKLRTKNTCKMDFSSKKRKLGNDEGSKIAEEFATLRETLEQSMAQILYVEQKLSERNENVREEEANMEERELQLRQRKDCVREGEAKMDAREFQLRGREDYVNAASDFAEKELDRVIAMEDELKKKEAELRKKYPLLFGPDTLRRWSITTNSLEQKEAKLREKEDAIQKKEAELWGAWDLKLKEREEAIQQKKAEKKARDSKLKEREEVMKVRDSKLKEREEVMKVRDSKLTEREEAIEQKEEAMKARDSKLTEQEKAIQQKYEILWSREMVKDKTAEYVEKRVATLEMELAALEKRKEVLLELQQQVDQEATRGMELRNTIKQMRYNIRYIERQVNEANPG